MADEREMTKEDKKFLMNALWGALIEQKWTKDHLIEFGKAIFAKQSLQEMDEKTFGVIFPYLNGVVVNLGGRIWTESERQRLSGEEPEADGQKKHNEGKASDKEKEEAKQP